MGIASSIVLVIAGLTGALLIWPIGQPWGSRMAHLHVNLFMGGPGEIIVLVCTWIGVVLILGGLYLWWKTKTFRIRTASGWRSFVIDLHYSLGVFTLLLTLVIAATGALRAHLGPGRARNVISRFHTTARFPQPVKAAYAVGSLAFVVEGITGVVMWAAKQRKARRS